MAGDEAKHGNGDLKILSCSCLTSSHEAMEHHALGGDLGKD